MPHQVCVRHSGSPVAWRCGPCNKDLCRECVVVAGAGDAEVSLCPFCGHPCQPAADAGMELPPISFFEELPGVPAYPTKGHGRYIILAWAVFWTVAGIVSFLMGGVPLGVMSLSGGVLPLLPFVLVMVVTSGHLSAYCFEIIAKSADGEQTPPDWPDIKDWWYDVIRPIGLMIGIVGFCFWPAAVARSLVSLEVIYANWPAWVLLAIGTLYVPMAFIRVTLWDSCSGLNPIAMTRAIIKIAPAYLTAWLALILLAGVEFIVVVYVLMPIPFLWLPLAAAAVMYFLLVQMRICGLLYGAHQDLLGWFSRR